MLFVLSLALVCVGERAHAAESYIQQYYREQVQASFGETMPSDHAFLRACTGTYTSGGRTVAFFSDGHAEYSKDDGPIARGKWSQSGTTITISFFGGSETIEASNDCETLNWDGKTFRRS